MSARRGHLLAEALCALALTGLVAAAAASALSHARRSLDAQESRLRGARTAAEAVAVTAALVRAADSVELVGDTALDVTTRVAEGVACARAGDTLVLPPLRPGDPTLLSVAMTPEALDVLRSQVRDTLTGQATWLQGVVDSVVVRRGPPACAAETGYADATDALRTRILLVVPGLDARVGPGTPVRIGRSGRLGPYGVGRGEWMLGWRRCAHGVCGLVQPLAGPLRAPRLGGFGVSRIADGTIAVRAAAPGTMPAQTITVPRIDAGR